MRQITSDEFKQAVNKNPTWASTITEPIEITDYCDMPNSKITHLSPLLTFSGKDKHGDSANFSGCKNLKIATGNYKGFVYFNKSGIEKIRNLKCGKDNSGDSANFSGCKNLRIATGNYEGAVNFSESGIEKIENLNCGKNNNGYSADFYGCKNLKVATGNYEGAVDFSYSGIEKIENLKCEKHKHRKSANFDDCKTLKIKDLSNKIIEQAINQKWVGVDFKNELKKRLILARIRESAIEIEF